MKILISVVTLATFMFASVDINNATAEEFATLKGVGTKKAEAIVEYRNTIKCFETLEALSSVKGIGEKTVEQNRADLILGECKK